MNACPEESVLRRFIHEDGLSESEAADVEGHVADCAACQRALELLTGDLSHLLSLRDGDVVLPPQRTTPEEFALSGYQVLRAIARSSSAAVYQARDLATPRVVAIKVLTATGKEVLRFAAEMQAVHTLRHPHIVTAHEICLREKWSYILMEFAEGGNLAQHLDGTSWPPQVAAELLAPLAGAVHFAHEHTVIHRDLKPANILLARAEPGQAGALTAGPARGWVPKLADFGLAKLLAQVPGPTASGDVLGTPSYMSPEQAQGKKELDAATDIYSLGAILYQLLTGRPPFVGHLPMDTLFQVVYQQPVPPSRIHPKLPRDLETICLKCLEKEPWRRYASARDVQEDLQRFLQGEKIRARPPSRRERAWTWVRRNRALAGVGLALLVLVLLLAGGGPLVAWRQVTLRREAENQQKRAEKIAQVSLDALDLLANTLAGENPAISEEEIPLSVRRTVARQLVPMIHRVLELGVDNGSAHAVEAKARLGNANLGRLIGKNLDELVADCRRAELLYAALAAQDPANPSYPRGQAAALNSAGVLLGLKGKRAECLNALRAARHAWERVVTAFPDDVNDRFHFGLCLNNLGNILKEVQDGVGARDMYGAAADEFRRLCDQQPDKFSWRNWLSRVLGDRGSLFLEMRDYARAETDLGQAKAIAAGLVQDYPGSRRAKECLYAALINLGELYNARQAHDRATRAFKEALALYEPLVRDYPEEVEYRWGQALALLALGDTQQQRGRFAESRLPLTEAVQRYAALAKEYPDQHQIAREYRRAKGIFLVACVLNAVTDLVRRTPLTFVRPVFPLGSPERGENQLKTAPE